jgi:hypothetical protein
MKLPDNFQMREHSRPCRFHITEYLHPNLNQYDSSELGEELCPVSSFLPLRVHKVYIRVSFSDTFLRWLPPIELSLSAEKKVSLLYLTG